MSFTNGKQRVVTKEDLSAPWSGHKDGSHFYCYLCGYSFQEGDGWRWLYATQKGLPNIMVCSNCDCDDVLERWQAIWDEWDKLSKGKFRFMATRMKDAEKEASYR